MKQKFTSLLLPLLFLAACAQLPFSINTPVATEEILPTPTSTAVLVASPPVPETTNLTLWVPPQFDPNAGTPAGDLMRERLNNFTLQNPTIRLDVRVKAEEGPGGILPALTAAHAAAPLAMPDVVALSNANLETAAIKGLIQPVDEFTTILESDDWYDYALQMIRLQDHNFGIPFAGDALVMIYRPSQIGEPPDSLEEALLLDETLTYPAAASEALFPLALYLASGGRIQDSEGRPDLDIPRLTNILNFFQSAEGTGLLPLWVTQFDSEELSLEAYQENRADMAVSWASSYLPDPPIDTVMGAIPTASGDPFALARGWVWALSTQDPDKIQASIRLAEFLSESDFMGTWTEEAGYVPTRPSALRIWPPSPLRTLVGILIQTAQVVPSKDLLTIVGPAIQDATIEVLKQTLTPDEAAREAGAGLASP